MITTRPVNEQDKSPWSRRARSIPAMLGATTVGIIGLPFLAVGAVIIDLARGRWKLPTVRVALFVLHHAVNDSIEILLAPLLGLFEVLSVIGRQAGDGPLGADPGRLLAGFGTRQSSEASRRRYVHVQNVSLRVLACRAEQLLGLRIEIDTASLAALTRGPQLTLCRHVNVVDASLPALLHQRVGLRTRGVMMAELLADPGFDLIYPHARSVFIPRADGPAASAALTALTADLGDDLAVVLFPEGRLFRPGPSGCDSHSPASRTATPNVPIAWRVSVTSCRHDPAVSSRSRPRARRRHRHHRPHRT